MATYDAMSTARAIAAAAAARDDDGQEDDHMDGGGGGASAALPSASPVPLSAPLAPPPLAALLASSPPAAAAVAGAAPPALLPPVDPAGGDAPRPFPSTPAAGRSPFSSVPSSPFSNGRPPPRAAAGPGPRIHQSRWEGAGIVAQLRSPVPAHESKAERVPLPSFVFAAAALAAPASGVHKYFIDFPAKQRPFPAAAGPFALRRPVLSFFTTEAKRVGHSPPAGLLDHFVARSLSQHGSGWQLVVSSPHSAEALNTGLLSAISLHARLAPPPISRGTFGPVPVASVHPVLALAPSFPSATFTRRVERYDGGFQVSRPSFDFSVATKDLPRLHSALLSLLPSLQLRVDDRSHRRALACTHCCRAGHLHKQCPDALNPRACARCGSHDHLRAACVEQKVRPCGVCDDSSHSTTSCPRTLRKLVLLPPPRPPAPAKVIPPVAPLLPAPAGLVSVAVAAVSPGLARTSSQMVLRARMSSSPASASPAALPSVVDLATAIASLAVIEAAIQQLFASLAICKNFLLSSPAAAPATAAPLPAPSSSPPPASFSSSLSSSSSSSSSSAAGDGFTVQGRRSKRSRRSPRVSPSVSPRRSSSSSPPPATPATVRPTATPSTSCRTDRMASRNARTEQCATSSV